MTGFKTTASRASRRHQMVRAAFFPSRANLGRRVAVGAAWQFGLVAMRIVLTIASTAVLARLLTPTDYGLNGMSAVVIEIAALLTNLGFGPILTQKPKLTRLDLDSAFWVSIGIGCGLTLLIFALSYPAALFFGQPELVPILCVASLSFIIQEAGVVPGAVFNRLLRFKEEVLIQLAGMVLRISLAIYLAWAGAGYWSLVLAPLISSALATAFSLWYVGYTPRLKFNRNFIAHNWRASGSYLGGGLLTHLLANFDYMVVGRRFGPEQLGFYQTAFTLPDELRSRFAGPLQRVLMPAYALLQSDTPAFRRSFLQSIKLFAAIMFPLGLGMAATADHIVPLLYGEQWLPVIPILQVLALTGALRAVMSLVGSIYSAKGVPQLSFKIQLWMTPPSLCLIYAGSFFGVIGVAWGVAFAQLCGLVGAAVAMKLLDASLLDFLRAISSSVIAAVLMFLTLRSPLLSAGIADLSLVSRLALTVMLGAMVYLTLWSLMERNLVLQLYAKSRKIDRSPSSAV